MAPGPTATDMFLEGKDDEILARLANAVPLDRLGTPTDIAEAVAFVTRARPRVLQAPHPPHARSAGRS